VTACSGGLVCSTSPPRAGVRRWGLAVGVLAFGAFCTACDDDPPTNTAEAGGEDDAGGDDGADPGATCLGVGGAAAVGDLCTRNRDCASGVCSIFRDAPLNEGATCLETPSDCRTHVMGTVLDFATGAAVADAPVVVAAALDAIDDPLEAEPILVLHADGTGRIDGVTEGPLDVPLAVLALSAAEDYALSATGIAQPPLIGGTRYEVATGIHDVWLVPLDLSRDWSSALADDEEVPADLLPLGTGGAIVGLVRDRTGQPIAGADVYSEDPESQAIIRTVADDGSMSTGPTGSSGMFVVLRSETPETFAAIRDGDEVGRATSGRIPGALFVMVVQDLSGG
jgi:hypothetical protein